MKVSEQHQKKYADFLRMIEETKKVSSSDGQPQMGDNYDEIITNLGLLSESELILGFANPNGQECRAEGCENNAAEESNFCGQCHPVTVT
jgi:hypothetical protein